MKRHYRIIIAAFQLVRAHGSELFCKVVVKYRKSEVKSMQKQKEIPGHVEPGTTN